MKSKKILIWFFTAVLLIITAFGLSCYVKSGDVFPIYAMVRIGKEEEKIEIWKNEENDYYFFLPSYTKLSETKLYLDTDTKVKIGEKTVKNGMECSSFELNVPYSFEFSNFARDNKYSVTFLKSDHIPTIHIDTESGNMDYIHDKKGNEEKGKIRIYTKDGISDFNGDLESIKGRGNYSWLSYDKKPYSLKLSNEASLLGMGKAQKWILLANAGDSSNMRNKLVCDFSKKIGLEYTTDSKWIDLYLNNEYAGLYQLSERNEVHPERVNISNNTSFLVSLEVKSKLEAQDYTFVTTNANQALRVHHPLNANVDIIQDILKKIQIVEDTIITDKDDGLWKEFIDLDSWAKKYLIEEVFGNGDAGAISHFFYFDAEKDSKKIFAGPVWDYDRTMGNEVSWQLTYPNSFFANRLYVDSGYETPWFYNLYRKKDFLNRITELYKTECIPFSKCELERILDDYVSEISYAGKLNQIRWNLSKDVETEAEYIHNFLNKRVEFLNSLWIDNQDYYVVRMSQDSGVHYAYVLIKPGECFSDLHMFEDNEFSVFKGWYYEGTDEPFDATKPITEDIEIYAKWEDSSSNKLDNVIKLIPLGLIAVMFVVFLIIEVKRIKNGGDGLWQKKRQ